MLTCNFFVRDAVRLSVRCACATDVEVASRTAWASAWEREADAPEAASVSGSEDQRPGPDQVGEPLPLLRLEQRMDLPQRLHHHLPQPLGAPHPERRALGSPLLVEGR